MNLSPKYVSAANKQCRFDPEEPEDMDEDVQITMLFACRMVMGPLSHRDFDFQDIIDNISKWTEQYRPVRILVKDVCHPHIMRFKSSVMSNRLLPLSLCLILGPREEEFDPIFIS